MIVGPSGCGKYAAADDCGIIPITSGKLAINGQIMNAVPPKDESCQWFSKLCLVPFLDVAANAGLQARKCARKSSVGSMPR